MSSMLLGVLLGAALVADEPTAALEQGQAWSVVGGRTVGERRGAFEFGVGFPQVSVAYRRGLAPRFDVGGRVSFVYAQEGMVRAIVPGLKLQGLLKFQLVDSGAVSVAATFEPGPLFNVFAYGGYPYPSTTLWGFALPLGVRVGVAASSALTLGISFDLPIWIQFGTLGGVNVPVLPGVGVEYFVKSDLLLFARVRMGPTIRPWPYTAEFTLDACIGLGLRL